MDRQEFGHFFAELREKSGFKSQRQLAIASGVSNGTIARIEAGTQQARPLTLKKLSPYLKNITYHELLRLAGYLEIVGEGTDGNPSDMITIQVTAEEHRLLEELKKHRVMYQDLIADPVKGVGRLKRMWEFIKEDREKYDG